MYIKENKKQYLDGEFMHSRFISSSLGQRAETKVYLLILLWIFNNGGREILIPTVNEQTPETAPQW